MKTTNPLQPHGFKLIKRIGHVARNIHLLSDGGTSLACGASDIKRLVAFRHGVVDVHHFLAEVTGRPQTE